MTLCVMNCWIVGRRPLQSCANPQRELVAKIVSPFVIIALAIIIAFECHLLPLLVTIDEDLSKEMK